MKKRNFKEHYGAKIASFVAVIMLNGIGSYLISVGKHMQRK